MHKKFIKLYRGDKGYVSAEDLRQVSDFKSSDLNNLIASQLTSGISDQVDFKKLLMSLSAFHHNQQDAKLRFLFEMCDSQKHGKLSPKDLIAAFRLIKVEHFNDSEIQEIAAQTVKFADHDGDGYLNFDEFKNFYNNVLQITI